LFEEINQAEKQMREHGYCHASWQPEVLALAKPIELGAQIYVVNVSVSSDEETAGLIRKLAPILIQLHADIEGALKHS
jgi:DNA-binding IclR family transcriptional regulator